MNENQLICDDAALDEVLRQDVAAVPSEELIAHIETCHRCQQRISEWAGPTDMWRAVKAAMSVEEGSDQRRRFPSGTFDPSAIHWTESMAKQLLSPPTHPEMLGRLGRYEVERLIGSGGMGVVFKAFDTELNRPVAIKLLAPYLASSGAARKRFAREARAAAAVVHQHVVPIHNVETERESPFIVMQYVSGESLQARIDREGPLELCEILRIGMQVADGLSAAHQQGLVHRDIKPSNILLEEDVDRSLISDFGLARAADDASLTRTGFHPGTPQYMSPEQALGQSVDARSDLFSLGSMIYTMCTGRPPFRAENSLSVMRRITDSEATPIREINPNIPEWLCTLIARLMSKQMENRPQSSVVVRDLLGSCLSHVQQPLTCPLPTVLAPTKQTRSMRSVAFLIGVSAMIFIALAIWFQVGLLTDMPQTDTAPPNAIGDSRTDGKQPEAIQPAEARLQKLVENHPIVVHIVLEKAEYTGKLNSHRVHVKKIYKGQNLDVKAVFAHLAFHDDEYLLSSKKPKVQMPELMAGEYLVVLEAEPVTDSFAISSFGLRVAPEPSFNYTIARDGDQHAAWPVDSQQAQTVIRLCAADTTSSQTPERPKGADHFDALVP